METKSIKEIAEDFKAFISSANKWNVFKMNFNDIRLDEKYDDRFFVSLFSIGEDEINALKPFLEKNDLLYVILPFAIAEIRLYIFKKL